MNTYTSNRPTRRLCAVAGCHEEFDVPRLGGIPTLCAEHKAERRAQRTRARELAAYGVAACTTFGCLGTWDRNSRGAAARFCASCGEERRREQARASYVRARLKRELVAA